MFPEENKVEVLRRELALLTVEEYMETVRDLRFPQRSEMWVFGRQYFGDDVYIKIRVELVSMAHAGGDGFVLVMSFHYAAWDYKESDFPYKRF